MKPAPADPSVADPTASSCDADLDELRVLLALVQVGRDRLSAALAARCVSEAGRELARDRLRDPTIEALRELLDEVQQATRLRAEGGSHPRAAGLEPGELPGDEALARADFLEACVDLGAALGRAGRAPLDPEVLARAQELFTPPPPPVERLAFRTPQVAARRAPAPEERAPVAAPAKGAGAPLDLPKRDEAERPAVGTVTVGMKVFVPRLRTEAQVVEVLSGGQVRVAAGPLKLLTSIDELRSAKPAPGKASGGGGGGARRDDRARRTSAAPFDAAADPDLPIQTSNNTVDLRGLRAHEAVAMAEQHLDRCLGQGLRVAFLIHGHGTGALRKEIRDAVRTSPYVERSRPGEHGEGGDGVTVVWLR